MLAMNSLQTLLDSIAAEVPIVDGAIGVDGSVVGTVAYGAAQNLATLRAIADADVQADLMATLRQRAAVVTAPALYLAFGGRSVQRALDYHYSKFGAGDLNRQLTAFALRVHPNLRKLGFTLDAPNVFVSPTVDPIATYAVTGANAGALALITTIDENFYAPAALSLTTTAIIGANAIAVTLTLRDAAGAQSVQVVNVPANSANGTVIAIPGRHLGVVNITIVGGTNGDAFKVTAPSERAINL